jgi:KipI family sensor histidine kinase inhibitor
VSRGIAEPGGFEVRRVAERALLVRFLDGDLGGAVARAQRLAARLAVEEMPRRGERVLGAGNLLLLFEGPEAVDLSVAREQVLRWCERLAEEEPEGSSASIGGVGSAASAAAAGATGAAGEERRVEVVYGGDQGPDLEAVARATRLSPQRVVELHSGAQYRVAFIGFSPGFPYLIGLPPELELPRRAVPRSRVQAGSVAIAGPFAGVYPSSTPGGWHVLGRTEATLFDPAAWPPASFAPGDRVRFVERAGTS